MQSTSREMSYFTTTAYSVLNSSFLTGGPDVYNNGEQ